MHDRLNSTMRTVSWDPEGETVCIIDQRRLPGALKVQRLSTPEEVAEAIRVMAVRGAPAIGVAAAFGLGLAGLTSEAPTPSGVLEDVRRAALSLRSARPTAVNLQWAIERALRACEAAVPLGLEVARRSALEEAVRMADEDVARNRCIGEHGAGLISDGDTVIHHCNTGALATVDYGTALGVIRTAHERGKHVHVLVDETRPRLQGSRLTAWELEQYGIPYDIIPDAAAAHLLRQGGVASVFVGADRVAANGDVANKIGTYPLALAAGDNRVPFYCVFPTSTIDLQLVSGEGIPIEERDPAEVLDLQREGQPVAPAGAHARNPAFDVTPHRLITAMVTETGILRPPFAAALSRAVAEANAL
jgi:methylthioribose-1-phosphate isomerase